MHGCIPPGPAVTRDRMTQRQANLFGAAWLPSRLDVFSEIKVYRRACNYFEHLIY